MEVQPNEERIQAFTSDSGRKRDVPTSVDELLHQLDVKGKSKDEQCAAVAQFMTLPEAGPLSQPMRATLCWRGLI